MGIKWKLPRVLCIIYMQVLEYIMHFDDSLFEQEDRRGLKRVEASKVNYLAKRCELNWFNQSHGVPPGSSDDIPVNFVVCKHRADLLYSQKEYCESAVQYEAALKDVPPSNTVVCRELTDSLARCFLHMGEFDKALEKAQLLIQPPYENNWSAWKLIAVCQKGLQNVEDQVISLQKCTSLQRYQPDFWTCLAEGYSTLGLKFQPKETSEKSISEREVSRHPTVELSRLVTILENTFALFRPYFSWVSLPKFNSPKQPIGCNSPDEDTCSDSVSGIETPSDIVLGCHGCCIFNGLVFPQGHQESYSDVILKRTSGSLRPPCFNFESSSSLCFIHSPFAVLFSAQISVNDFNSMLNQLICSDSIQSRVPFVKDILSCFFLMAECSCLLWTRQLLVYFRRYSHSFVRDARKNELERVERQIDSCHGGVRKCLEVFFNRKRVFDETS